MATTTTFTVGRDCTAVLTSPYGTNVTLPLETQIDTTPEYSTASSVPLNTPPIERYIPKGHRIKIMSDRADATLDQLFSQIEAGWWANGTPDGGTNASATLYIYINEAAGGQTVIEYAGMSISLSNSGSISPDSPVKQEITGFAQTRIVS
jgi:hypothetical protein